jgi:NADH-quinone oxidoreductase subunit J
MGINIFLLVIMMFAAMWTVMTRSLLKSTIALAFTSAILSVLIFRMNAPMAAVFELSVCAGLITAVFVSTISLTKPLTHKEIVALSRNRIKRFIYLPLVIVLAASAFYGLHHMNVKKVLPVSRLPAAADDVRLVLWNLRQLDLFGQIIIIIAGAIGVVILFEEKKKDEW